MDDLIRLQGGPWDGENRVTRVWPPPERIELEGGAYRQTRRSQLSDEEAAALPFIIRAAEYEWESG